MPRIPRLFLFVVVVALSFIAIVGCKRRLREFDEGTQVAHASKECASKTTVDECTVCCHHSDATYNGAIGARGCTCSTTSATYARPATGSTELQTLSNPDGKLSLRVPGTWKAVSDLSTEARVQARSDSGRGTRYVTLMSLNRLDSRSSTLAAFATQNIERTRSNFEDGKTKGPEAGTVNGHPSLAYEITGGVGSVNIKGIITYTETAEAFFWIFTWTLVSEYPVAEKELKAIAASFTSK